MNQLLAAEWFVIPAVAIAVFVVSYLWSDRIITWLHDRSLGQREEVLRYFELMFVETDRKRVTLMMLSASFGLGALLVVMLWPNLIAGSIIGGAVTIAMWSVPKFIVKNLYEKRCGQFVDQMVDGMTLMANGVKAGLSVQQCMERIQENMPNPISQEFGLVISQMRLGRGMADALNELGMRIPRPDVQMFVTSVNILQETGGNMAETFQTITYTIRERQKLDKKIEALTAQAMTQGMIISAMPLALFVIFYLVDPAFVEPLYTTTLGYIALMMMLILIIIGGVVMRKIAKIEV